MMTTFFTTKQRLAACITGMTLGAGLALCPAGLNEAEASFLDGPYDSDAESGVEALDWIENRDRALRKNMDTKEQQRLKKDIAEMKRALDRDRRRDAAAEAAGTAAAQPEPTDGTFGSVSKSKRKDEQPPISFEGDDIFYDQNTGNVYAKGSVKITRIDGKRVITEQADGNTKDQNVRLPEGGQFVNIAPGESKADMTGYRILYNYGRRTGSMENGQGQGSGLVHFRQAHRDISGSDDHLQWDGQRLLRQASGLPHVCQKGGDLAGYNGHAQRGLLAGGGADRLGAADHQGPDEGVDPSLLS